MSHHLVARRWACRIHLLLLLLPLAPLAAQDAARIAGVVRDSLSGRPLEWVELTAGDRVVTTDAEGRFLLAGVSAETSVLLPEST